MPCSRTEAPFAQCAPRLIGESNTGSWRTQTPFSTCASIAQPTEQCVHTVRLISTLPAGFSSFASAIPITLNGSWVAIPAAPAVIPERFRNVRRSIVFAITPASPRARRDGEVTLAFAVLVSSIAFSSDFRRAVVIADMRRLAIPRGGAFRVSISCGTLLRTLRGDRCCSRDAPCADRQQKISAGEDRFFLTHACLLRVSRMSGPSHQMHQIRARVISPQQVTPVLLVDQE